MTTETEKPALQRARSQGHQPFNDLVRRDWERFIRQSPDNFDALLYRPNREETQAAMTGAMFGMGDMQQATISYEQEPELVAALVAPLDDDGFMSMWDGDAMGMGDSGILTVLLSCVLAPEGSILEWKEETAAGDVRSVFWYVQNVRAVGSAAVGALHTCVPCGDLTQAKLEAAKVAMGENNDE